MSRTHSNLPLSVTTARRLYILITFEILCLFGITKILMQYFQNKLSSLSCVKKLCNHFHGHSCPVTFSFSTQPTDMQLHPNGNEHKWKLSSSRRSSNYVYHSSGLVSRFWNPVSCLCTQSTNLFPPPAQQFCCSSTGFPQPASALPAFWQRSCSRSEHIQLLS